MTTNHNHEDASPGRKIFKSCDNGGAGPNWSDLNYNVLYLVMMKLGVVDFLSFGGVCKSWRSLVLSNRNMFMASKPPMTMSICRGGRKIKAFFLEDFEGRNFKTNPPFVDEACFLGLTCGYLIFFRKTTCDFLLVNPITRHELYFTNVPFNCSLLVSMRSVRAILVFSLSICGWVFVIMHKRSNRIWFSTAGTGAWNHVACISYFTDLCAFKGKTYTLNRNTHSLLYELYELRLNSEPKLTLLETKNSLKASYNPELVSSGENIYVMDRDPLNRINYRYMFQELDFGEMKWVSREKTEGESTSFLSDFKHGVAVNPELCGTRRQGLLLGHNRGDMLKLLEVEKASAFTTNIWYFPHEYVDLINE